MSAEQLDANLLICQWSVFQQTGNSLRSPVGRETAAIDFSNFRQHGNCSEIVRFSGFEGCAYGHHFVAQVSV